MRHISLTPFGRQPVTASHLAARALADAPVAHDLTPGKWAILRDLTAARRDFAITDRALVVLSALLSFYPRDTLTRDEALIVFPSNAALSERAHGMPEATLRRHLAALVGAGLLVRHDSPNGKRYAVRGDDGALSLAFGFDLRPLLVRAPEIAAKAADARALVARCKRLRERIRLALRDIAKLLEWLAPTGLADGALPELSRKFRRKLDEDALVRLATEAEALRQTLANRAIVPHETAEMSACDCQNERHQQRSEKDSYESEESDEQASPSLALSAASPPALPLGLVLKAAPDIVPYARHGLDSWSDLLATAEAVRPMMGVSPDAWAQARRFMGPVGAAIALACMLQDIARLRSPGGYLRSLSQKAAEGGFNVGAMVMALLRREDRVAA